MIPYTLYVFCDDCSDVHPMPIKIHLGKGPDSKQSIGEAYEGKRVPEKLSRLARNVVRCPKTGKSFVQKDDRHVFLVPSEEREL